MSKAKAETSSEWELDLELSDDGKEPPAISTGSTVAETNPGAPGNDRGDGGDQR